MKSETKPVYHVKLLSFKSGFGTKKLEEHLNDIVKTNPTWELVSTMLNTYVEDNISKFEYVTTWKENI